MTAGGLLLRDGAPAGVLGPLLLLSGGEQQVLDAVEHEQTRRDEKDDPPLGDRVLRVGAACGAVSSWLRGRQKRYRP